MSTLTLTAPLSSGFFVEKETNGANSSNAVSEKKGKISKKRKIAIGVGAAGAGAVVGVPILGWALYKTAKTLFKSTKP